MPLHAEREAGRIRDPDRFLFNNFGYHELNAQWRARSGYTSSMDLPSKLLFGLRTLSMPTNILLVAGLLWASANAWVGRGERDDEFVSVKYSWTGGRVNRAVKRITVADIPGR